MEKKRTCGGCGIEKPLTLEFFSKDKYRTEGLSFKCKICRAKATKEWSKANPEKAKQSSINSKEKRKEFYDSEVGIISSRKAHLKRMYGITLEQYEDMSQTQNHKCAICGRGEMNYKNKVLCVDHDHTTGKIRGLLCGRCNSALGKFLDSQEILKNAIKYLKKYEQFKSIVIS